MRELWSGLADHEQGAHGGVDFGAAIEAAVQAAHTAGAVGYETAIRAAQDAVKGKLKSTRQAAGALPSSSVVAGLYLK